MPRIARGIAGGYIYHVLNRGNGGQRVFHKNDDYKSFITLLSEALINIPIKILAYCIMPNHFHLVLMPKENNDLSRWMQWLMTSHVRRYHCHYGTSGHVWQGRFKSFLVQEDKHLLTVIRYVEGNPVRSNIVQSAMDWPWSSFRARIKYKKDQMLSDLPLALPEDWRNFVDEPITPTEIERLAVSLQRQRPFGFPEWQMRICKEMNLESTLSPRGRPKNTKSSRSPF